MLADREHVKPDLLGLLRDLGDRVDPLRLARRVARHRVPGDVADREDPELHALPPIYVALVAEERGFAIPTEASFDREAGPDGALYVGSPETVANKIAANMRALGATRFDLKYGLPGLTHDQLMTTVELYGREVIPRVRELLG